MAPPTRTSLIGILFPRQFSHWLGPLLAAGIAALVIAFAVIASGVVNLAASTPHPQGWAALLHYVFQRSVAHHADAVPPADLDTQPRIQKGAVYFSRVCASCHGAPGLGQNPVALSMRPRPQYLPLVVGQYSAPELHWILQHGVKYSAMPSWPALSRGDEVWSIVAFLRALPKLDRTTYDALAQGPAGPAAGVMGFAPPAEAVKAQAYAMPNMNEYPSESQYTRPATAFGRGTVGPDLAASCVQCHGTDGAGRPGGAFPNLTVLNATTIKEALLAYADGSRESAYMQPVATQLTDGQIDTLSTHFAALPKARSPQFAATPEMLALGRQIAEGGIPAKNVGACQNCHDINKANKRLYPAIAGQNVLYLRDQLRLYREGLRGAKLKANPMILVAKGMTDAQIDASAAFYAAMVPQAVDAVAEGRVNPATTATRLPSGSPILHR